MKIFVAVFAIAGACSITTDVVYWFVAHVEPAGVAFFSMLTIALFWVALYAVVAERNARLVGDDPDATHGEAAGEDVGIYTTQTPLPFIIAICAVFVLAGLVWSPPLGVVALAAALICFWRLGHESART